MFTVRDEPSIPVTVSLSAIPGNNPVPPLTDPCSVSSGSFWQLWKAEERKGMRPYYIAILSKRHKGKKIKDCSIKGGKSYFSKF